MRILLLLGLVVLGGCGRASIEPQFQPYVDQFSSDALAHGRDIGRLQIVSIRLVDSIDTSGETYGVCAGFTVSIAKSFWGMATDLQRKELIYHELGHCVLGKVHSSDPSDLMYPSVGRISEQEWDQSSGDILGRFFSQNIPVNF